VLGRGTDLIGRRKAADHRRSVARGTGPVNEIAISLGDEFSGGPPPAAGANEAIGVGKLVPTEYPR
jgi:hypothetical protein